MNDDEFNSLCEAHSFGAVARGEFPLVPRGLLKALVDAAVAAERERPRQVVAYMATNREGEMRFTDSPDAARELEGYGWAITPLADAGPNVGAEPTAEAGADWPRRDDDNNGPERPSAGCRSGSARARC